MGANIITMLKEDFWGAVGFGLGIGAIIFTIIMMIVVAL